MTSVDGLLSRVVTGLHQRVCGLHGHDSLLHFDQGRISLLCTSCGHESPGWDVKGAHQAQRAEETTHVMHVPLVQERRVA